MALPFATAGRRRSFGRYDNCDWNRIVVVVEIELVIDEYKVNSKLVNDGLEDEQNTRQARI